MISFLLASLLFLIILWLVLTVFLDDIYRAVKKYESARVFSSVCEEAEGKGSADLSRFDERYDTMVFLVAEDGTILDQSPNAALSPSVSSWIGKLLKHLYSQMQGKQGRQRIFMHDGDFEALAAGADISTISQKEQSATDRILEMKLTFIEGRETLILTTTKLYPVKLTTLSIRWVLIFGSAAFVLFSVVSSIILARQIAYPIEKITKSAARIAEGDYSVDFPENRIAEINELSDTLNYTTKELKVAEDLQHEIIANISHDLRTPLTMIRGYAEVMRDLPDEKSAENLQIIIDETDRLSDLLSDVLYAGRLQSAQEIPKKTVFSLSGSIVGILYRIGKLKAAEGYDFVLQDAGHEIFIEADAGEINRVLYNLIGNAISYSGEDRRVIVREEEILQDGKNFVKVSVTDHGKGIAEKDLPHIWERYFKADRENRDRQVGTGLGLSIAANILKMHDASYGAESKEGEGSTFWFILPVSEAWPE